jgi:membrane-bound metal-dependent hydrolase YbcI (DUF457 family)
MASPLGHAAVGAATALVVARATGTPDSAALWVGALVASGIPDLDVLLPLLGAGPRTHRNATHSLVVVAGVILAGLAAVRWLELGWSGGLLWAWAMALVSHPLLDVATTGTTLGGSGWGIPLFWPFSRRRFSLRRPLLVSDRSQSHSLADVLRETREDAVRLAQIGALIILLAELWG